MAQASDGYAQPMEREWHIVASVGIHPNSGIRRRERVNSWEIFTGSSNIKALCYGLVQTIETVEVCFAMGGSAARHSKVQQGGVRRSKAQYKTKG
jgi:hypothetical protein